MKKIIISIFVLAFVLGLSSGCAFAKNINPSEEDNIPEANGTYDIPGNPNLKVRVFVHYPKIKNNIIDSSICTEDQDSSSVVSSTPWKLRNGTWNYYLNSSSVPASVGTANLSTITSGAFNQWQNAQAKVTFISKGEAKISTKKLDGKNIITFGKASGTALGVTYTWYNPSTGYVVENDTILNSKFSWFWSGNNQCTTSAYEVQDILTHELGHWMGLNDHYTSAYANNTMYGYGFKGDTKNITLTKGDIAGVLKIYL